MNIQFRFKRGQGLELSGAEKTQAGYLQLENGDLTQRDVVEKHKGAPSVAATTTTSPDEAIPAGDLQAVFHRGAELLLQTNHTLYSRRECAGSGTETLGTATPTEISDALDELDQRLLPTYEVTIPLAGSALTAGAYDRLDRQDVAFDSIFYENALVQTIAGQLEFVVGRLRLKWFGISVTPGFVEFEPGATNPRHFQISTGFGRVWYAVPPASGRANRCDVKAHSVFAGANPARLDVTLLFTIADVLGDPTNSCADGSAEAVYAFSDPGAIDPRVVVDGGAPRALGSAVRALLAQGTTGYVFDAIDNPGADGPRVAVANLGADIVQYLRFPNSSGSPATTEETFQSGQHEVGDRLGINYLAGDDVVGSRLAAVPSRFTRDRNAGAFDFDDVETGDLSLEYESTSVNGLFRRLDLAPKIAGTKLYTQVLLAETDPSTDYQVAELPAGPHVVLAMNRAISTAHVWIYADLGAIAPTEETHTAANGYVATDGIALIYGWADASAHHLRHSTDLLSFSALTVQLPAVVSPPATMTLSVGDLGGGDVEIVGSQYYGDLLQLVTYSVDSLNPTQVNLRTDAVTMQAATAVHLQLGLYPRILWAVESTTGTREVYEVDLSLLVRVSPAVVALAGGNWGARGPWTRGRLRVAQTMDWGLQPALMAPAAPVLGAGAVLGDRPCILQLADIDPVEPNAGIQALVISTHTESGGVASPVVLDATGRAPHVVTCTAFVAAFTLVTDAEDIQYDFWSPGDSFSLTSTGITAHDPGAPIYDLCGGESAELGYYGLIARDSLDNARVQIRDIEDNVLADFFANLSEGNPDAVAIYAHPEQLLPTFVIAVVGAVGGGYRVGVQTFTVASGVPTVLWSREWLTGGLGDSVPAVTVGGDRPVSGTSAALVTVEVLPAQECVTSEVTGTTDQQIRVDLGSAVFGSYVERAGQLIHVQSSIDAITFDVTRRNGLFGIAPRTGEIVARAGFGSVETPALRSLRSQVSDFNPLADVSYLGWPFATGARLESTTGTKVLQWDTAGRPNRPAELQRTIASAHAGYPRGYDAVRVYEQDWHELSRITLVADIAGGLPPGEYGLAASFDWYDSQGNLHRCSPHFRRITLLASGAIEVTAKPLRRTERTGATLSFWRTLVNGIVYHREVAVDAQAGVDITVQLTTPDSILARLEILDQVPGVTAPSEIARVTDWLAFADGRLWSRDPERGELARFSIPASEGKAPHWPLVQAVESPDAAPAVGLASLDGRLLLWSPRAVSYFGDGGPDAAGNGSYGIPSLVPSSTGATSYESLALLPDGYVYGTTRAPYLLSRGIQTQQLGDQVYAPYEIDGERLEVAAWRPNLGDLVLSNGPAGRTFRFNRSTGRWGEDTGRAALDLAVSVGQEFVTLVSDGRVLVERLDASPTFTDGGIAYQLAVSTPWFHPPAKDALVHGGMNITRITLWGTAVADHRLELQVYRNYSAVPVYSAEVPLTRVSENQAADKPYLYSAPIQVSAYAARVVVQDSVEPTATWRLAGIDVAVDVTGEGSSTLNLEHQFE